MDNLLTTTKDEILQFVAENDVKFIRLAFCDLFGMQKNISIMPHELDNAFSNGISFDASAIKGFCDVTHSDLFLKPDPTTLTLLPWRPQQGRVARFYCSIICPDSTPFIYDTREILKRTLDECKNKGYDCKIGAECEFYLFKADEDGNPTYEPYDNGGYFDMSPLDKGENIRREICLTLEDMGIRPESSHHEQGPGQNEIDFTFSDALTSADNFMTFKTAVKAIASRNGLFASFLPKPLQSKSGSGMHINLSLSKGNKNIFSDTNEENEISKQFIAGVLEKSSEISLFLNPIINSYERLGEFEAPSVVSWSKYNRSQLVRIPAASELRSRMELRSPDSSINPYLAYTLIIKAGLYGIEHNLTLQNPSDYNVYDTEDKTLLSLPHSLEEAIENAKNSDFIKNVLGEDLLNKVIEEKETEIKIYKNTTNRELALKKYFEII